MELHHLRYFLAVAREGNFTRAARRLAVAPSTLYRRLSELELDVGTALFDRSEAELRLSGPGHVFIPFARRIVEEATRIADTMGGLANSDRSVVRIGMFRVAAETPSVSTALARARRALPHLDIRLFVLPSFQQIEQVRRGWLDLAFIHASADTKGVASLPILDQRFVIAVPPGHRLAEMPDLRLADLADEDFIFQMRSDQGAIHDRLIATCSRAGLVPRIRHYFLDEDTQLQMVAAGMGISIALEGAQTRRWRHQVVFRRVGDLNLTIALELIWNPERVSPAGREVIDIVKQTNRATAAL